MFRLTVNFCFNLVRAVRRESVLTRKHVMSVILNNFHFRDDLRETNGLCCKRVRLKKKNVPLHTAQSISEPTANRIK